MEATTISLVKGQKVDLTKGNAGLKSLMVGLGWDPQSSAHAFDLDASVIMLRGGKFAGKSDLIYFGNKVSSEGSVKHDGDNLTGDGDGDDEQIHVDLSKVPADVDQLVFVVNIYEAEARGQNLGQVKNAFIRLVDAGAEAKPELLKYDLSEDFSVETGVNMGKLYRHNGEWKFEATGTGLRGNLQVICDTFI